MTAMEEAVTPLEEPTPPVVHPASTLTGTFRVHADVESQFLAHKRNVLVMLPPGYDEEPERRYPVFYMNDGQNLFDATTAFGGQEWHVDETADSMIRAGQIEPMIIVGIYNTGQHRIHEYTPSVDKKQRRRWGKAVRALPGRRAQADDRLHLSDTASE
jgi:enterochelin esterase-like enzyme